MTIDPGDPLAVALGLMASTPRAIATIVLGASAAALERRPAPGEWSPHEVLSHMLEVEGRLRKRIAAMAAAPDGTPFPTASDTSPASLLVPETLGLWRRRRAANLYWFRTLGPNELARIGEHRRFGPISVREHIVEWSYHDLDHLRQLLASLQADLYPSIGGWRGLYPPPFLEPGAPVAS